MGLLDHIIFLLLVFWGPCLLFSTVCNNLPSHQECGRFPFLHTLSSIYCLQIFFDDGHSGWCKWYLTVVLICISRIIRDVEHLFLGLLAISKKRLSLKDLRHTVLLKPMWTESKGKWQTVGEIPSKCLRSGVEGVGAAGITRDGSVPQRPFSPLGAFQCLLRHPGFLQHHWTHQWSRAQTFFTFHLSYFLK